MTPRLVYATVNKSTGKMHSITITSRGKAKTQIGYRSHKDLDEHAHDWDYSTGTPRRGTGRPLTGGERRLFDRVNAEYRKHGKQKE
jgi:hypothetical protein